MSKRRRKDNLYKIHHGNIDGDEQSDDYTADCETHDFMNDGKPENIDFSQKLIKSSNYQDSYEALKCDFSQLLSECEEQNSEYICRDFIRNMCRRGRKCKFKHPASIKRSWLVKNDTNSTGQFEVNFCHDYQNHGCNRPNCRFIHCNRPEQEFYYATGILLSSVFCNNIQVPYCKDFLNNACTRIKCKFLHLSKEEIEQQNKNHETVNNSNIDYANYTHQSSIDQTMLQPATNGNFYSNFHDHFPSSQQMNVMPSQTISIGNSLPLTNAQFTVSLPLGSVSYSTSQQQLIAQPSLTNVQYIHDPILSSVAHEVGPINSDVLNQLPASMGTTSMVNQIHPQPQQVVYSSIIHNPGVSLPQHHTIPPQFTLISSDNQSHSQLLSAPLPVGSSNASAHIINPVAVAHPNPSQNQQYTISQQPPVGMSIFSVATPCSLLSASPTTAEVMHTIQQQQMRSYDQKDQACIVQKSMQPNTNIDLAVNDNSHLNSTLTPIYIQHNLPSAVPVTQYRVTALETTTTPGLVIHNTLDPNNLQLLQTTSSINNPPDRIINSSNNNTGGVGSNLNNCDQKTNVKFVNAKKSSSTKDKIDQYSQIIKENEKLKRKLLDLQKQTSDLQTANELLLDQNARLRNFKTCCNSSNSNSGSVSLDTKPLDSEERGHGPHNTQLFGSIQHNPINPIISNQSMLCSKQNEVVSNSAMSEMATITLTVPIGITHSSNPSIDHGSGASSSSIAASYNSISNIGGVGGGAINSGFTSTGAPNELATTKLKLPSAEISYLLAGTDESIYKNVVCTTAECSDYISPTLMSSALRSIQKSVMPTLHALVASSNAIKTTDDHCSKPPPLLPPLKMESDGSNPNTSSTMEIPVRSSSCPVTCTYKSIPEQTIKCHESTSSTKVCCVRLSNFNQTPQLCFQ